MDVKLSNGYEIRIRAAKKFIYECLEYGQPWHCREQAYEKFCKPPELP